MKKESQRITALTMSAMLMLNITATAVPVSAESGSKVYTHDGYTVEYTIKNEWTGNQNIEVTITNTGDDVLSGWAMGYNAFGEIGGLWNAKIYGHQGTEYILSSAGYNDELAPGQSTNFGYTLTGDKFKIPQNIVNCAERVDITEGYNVYYNITGDYGDTYQAEMVIENLSDTDINAWQLNFDGNASIDNLWNGKLLENNNGSFKVKNAENNSVIAAGGSASFNFSGRKLAEEAESDVIETSAPATEPAAETTVVTDVSETDIAVGESETESISESEFVTERETVTEPATVIEQESETKTEVVFGNFKLTGIVIPMEFDFEIDPEIDSDEDGLPDYLEKEIGTDRYNADTDGDGLPDGYEYFILGTDPKKADSDDNGISDADEDFDEDRLTNLEEYELGTDPFSKDTDYDGLSDYDEVKIHNTDPLKYDTDGDKVSDGDEIELGLDPNNPATNGYPDNEYTTKQTVGEDSSALDYINTIEDNPYTVSVEITAAGVAKNNLSAGESGYSYSILQNDAVLGVVPELSYSDGLSVTDVVIKFKLDDSAVGNKLGVYADEPEFNGIKRLQVFKYFEDNNILLPIETFYDEETKTVYTHVDELGTYCLMDMEMWINYLENLEPGNYYEEDDEVKSANIAFCLDTRYISDESSFDSVKSDMKAIAEDAFDRYTDVKVYVYYQEMGMSFRAKDNLLMDKDGNNYFTSYEEAKAAIDGMSMPKKSVAYDLVHASNYMINLCDRSCKAEELDKNIITMYHIANDDNIVGSVNDSKQLIRTVEESAYTDENDEQAYRINVSVICPNGTAKENSYVRKLVDASKGIFYSDNTQEVQVQVMSLNLAANNNDRKTTKADAIKKNVIEICGDGDGCWYKAITSTSTTSLSIHLRGKLNKNSDTDTDGDGVYDWNEINVKLIEEFTGNKIKISNSDLPTFEELSDKMQELVNSKKTDSSLFYVEQGYNQLINKNAGMYYRGDKGAAKASIDRIKILPLISDPTRVDSDGDYMLDGIENKFVNNPIYWDIKDENPLYAYADTKDNYGVNAAGILVKKTSKSPNEYIVKKIVPLTYYLSQTQSTPSYGNNIAELTVASKIYLPFPYELQEYMQSCCDTVIREVKTNPKYANIESWRIDMLEKYLTPELLMAIGTTESGWTYGGMYDIGISETYTGIINSGASVMPNTVAGVNASTDKNDYINIYCSISGTTCLLAHDFLYVGDSRVGFEKKDYDITEKSFEQKFIYDVIYVYGSGCELDYYRSETRISSAYKIYAFNEFLKVNGSEWRDWTKELIGGHCNNVTTFTWIYNNPQEYSNVVLPQNSKVK